MKNLINYINDYCQISEEKQTTGAGSIEMIQTILDQLIKEHPDCKFDEKRQAWVGKDSDLWKGAGQFLFDYLKELNKQDLKAIMDHFGWGEYIQDINDIYPQEVGMCIAGVLYANQNKAN